MLKIIDLGCVRHPWRQLTLVSPESELMQSIILNLPREGEFHSYICEHGHTHYVKFHMQALKVA
jgi:hypothetical protein